jgi:nucleotide-binding universal stress UspA family protein
MKNILVPIGTSSNSGETLQYAVDFAKAFSAAVFVMDVFTVSAKTGSLANITKKVAQSSKERLKEVIAKVDAKDVKIKIATYNGNITDGLIEIDRELGIDLIIIAPRSNDINEEIYLGKTTGSIIKKTNIPALIVPKGTLFSPYKTALTAFKSGILKKRRMLEPLISIQKKMKTAVNLLLVKTPGYTEDDLKINPALMDLCSNLTVTENPTTYLGVLEHFRSHQPDLLVVFRRKRGFFKKLWEKSTILKAEFFAPIPVLVLRVKKD